MWAHYEGITTRERYISIVEVKGVILLLPDTSSVWGSIGEERSVMASMFRDPLFSGFRDRRDHV